jgi:hypothetical protein
VLVVHRDPTGRFRDAWHVDLARRTVQPLRALGISEAARAVSRDGLLAVSRDLERIDLVDLDGGTLVATVAIGPHTLLSMDGDFVVVLRNGALARIDLRDRSVTDLGEQTHEETAPISAIFVTDRGELVTVNAAGRRCAYDGDGALVAESNEPILSGLVGRRYVCLRADNGAVEKDGAHQALDFGARRVARSRADGAPAGRRRARLHDRGARVVIVPRAR